MIEDQWWYRCPLGTRGLFIGCCNWPMLTRESQYFFSFQFWKVGTEKQNKVIVDSIIKQENSSLPMIVSFDPSLKPRLLVSRLIIHLFDATIEITAPFLSTTIEIRGTDNSIHPSKRKSSHLFDFNGHRVFGRQGSSSTISSFVLVGCWTFFLVLDSRAIFADDCYSHQRFSFSFSVFFSLSLFLSLLFSRGKGR